MTFKIAIIEVRTQYELTNLLATLRTHNINRAGFNSWFTVDGGSTSDIFKRHGVEQVYVVVDPYSNDCMIYPHIPPLLTSLAHVVGWSEYEQLCKV